MGRALERHDDLIEQIVVEQGGKVVRPRGEGDSRFAVFARATDAVTAACSIQRAFLKEHWPLADPLRVRMAIHTGEAILRLGDYYGPAVNHCARLRAASHGGQVLVSAVTAELVREALPTAITLMDLGQHQLRDLEYPERIWQLLHPELPGEYPALSSAGTSPATNLPNQLSSFVGRADALAELLALLGTVRLLTLVGPGGIGKTRLALRLAAESQSTFQDGVWLVRLESVVEPLLVPATIAAVLGIGESRSSADPAVLADAIGSHQLLLVLDNCEHVLQTCAEVAELLLGACPRLRILATSREALGISGEVGWPVAPLSLPDLLRPERLAASEAERLFIERARATNPRFTLTGHNARALAEVCLRVDGLPLAIELAASRTRLLSLEQMASRLGDRLQLLTGGSRTALPRQQTLRSTIEWSYDMLSEREQVLFSRLSVFVGGWTLEAAETACAGGPVPRDQVLDLMGRLVDRSLVVVQHEEGGTEPRYRLLETLREYAREKMDASVDAEQANWQYVDYFIALGEQAHAHLNGGPEYAHWLERLEAEKDNLLAAMRLCRQQQDMERGLRLGGAVCRYWYVRRLLSQSREWLEALQIFTQDPARTAIRARALSGAGILASQLDDYDRAQAMFEESLGIYRELGDQGRTGTLLNNLGMIALNRRDFAAARALLEQSLSVAHEAGNEVRSAIVLNNLASLYETQGEYSIALRLYADSSVCYRHVRDSVGLSFALSREAHTALAEGQAEVARMLCEEGLDLARGVRHQGAVAACCLELGIVRLQQGDLAAARSLFQESLSINPGPRHADESARIPRCLAGLAGVEVAEGRPERALKLLSVAEQLHIARRWTGPFDRRSIDLCIAAARTALSPHDADTAWQAGAAFSLGDAVAYALELAPELTIASFA
jgi:predicted ATPase/Tfp pilus assembly protein PilF